MITHQDAIARIPAQTKVALTTKSNRAGLLHLSGHLGALTLTGGYIAVQAPLWGLALLPHGVLLVFLFTLSHECTHQTPFRTRWLNDLVGHAVAPLLALPFRWFRYFHLAHHRYTNDPDRDPELAGGGRPNTWRSYLVHLSGWSYWSGNATVIWRLAFGRLDAPYLPARHHAKARIEARALLAIYAVAALSLLWSPVLLWMWIVPALMGQPGLRLYLLAEHGHCPPVANMLANSRTTLTVRAVRWLAWNMPYHAEHHSFPTVPFHHLPALHAHLLPHLQGVSPGYVAFTQSYISSLER